MDMKDHDDDDRELGMLIRIQIKPCHSVCFSIINKILICSCISTQGVSS
jgi:hypothetical protein